VVDDGDQRRGAAGRADLSRWVAQRSVSATQGVACADHRRGYGAAMAATAPPLRRALRGRSPGLRLERDLWEAGHDVVVGVDEVGRGSWAGPLTVAAVVPPVASRLYKIRDSKMLTPAEREVMCERITGWARAWRRSSRPGGRSTRSTSNPITFSSTAVGTS
jgi:hypothetical protein